MSDGLTFRHVLRKARALGVSSPQITLGTAAFLFASYLAVDLLAGEEIGRFAYGVLGLVALYLQLLVTSVVLGASGIPGYTYDSRRPTRGRFPSAFGLGLGWIVTVAIGLLLGIIPGLILVVRWSLSLPALLAEDENILGSLRRSWELTRPHWKVVALSLAFGLALFLLSVLPLLPYSEFESPPMAAVISVNLLNAFASVANWLIVAALYSLAIRQAGNHSNSPALA